MRSIYPFLLSLVLVPAAAVVQADVLKIPAVKSGEPSMPMPKRGMTMQQVAKQFGPPSRKLPAVGNPPITRWIYDKYSVYFEKEHVIHSVLRRK